MIYSFATISLSISDLRTVITTAAQALTEKSEKQRFARVTALLLTIVFMAYYFYGIRAVLVAVVSVASSVFSDYLCVTAMRKKYDWGDESPVMSGLLLALLMPASVPYTIMAFSAAFMSSVCKHAFGGNKNLIFCPVCIAYIFTLFCFPSAIVRYPAPEPFGSVPIENTVSGITLGRSYTYMLDSGSASTFSLLDIIWGKLSGPMGSSAALIILICAVALYFFGDIPTVALFSGFGANIIINVIFPVGYSGWYAVLDSLAAGSYFFVLTFMACDPRYVPKKDFSQFMYGCIFAGASYLIRAYSGIENSAVFALPMLCIFKDEFDRLTAALARLLVFLHKWAKIIFGYVRKYLKIAALFSWKHIKRFTVWISKKCYGGFMALCDFISDRIVEASKKRSEKALEKEREKDIKEDISEDAEDDVIKDTVEDVKENVKENAEEDVEEDTVEDSDGGEQSCEESGCEKEAEK